MNIILLGPPGSGKGTQGALLSDHTGIPKVATGDLLRAAVSDGTPLGAQAKSYMDRGLLVPDEIILGLISEVLVSPEAARGIIMDGFPRTVAQAEAVDRFFAGRGERVDAVLALQVDDDEVVSRMLGRAAAEGRSDDTPEAMRRRLEVYREQTAPLLDHYRRLGSLREIMGVGSVEDIAGRVKEAIAT